MNDLARRLVMDRMNRENYSNDSAYMGHGHIDYNMNNDNRNDMNMDNRMDGRNDMNMDSRRGVYGTGPYGVGGSMYRGDRMNGHHKIKLTKRDMLKWKKDMMNADGSYGEKYNMEQIMQMADKLGVRFESYDEKDLCMATNMIYSDFCKKAKKYIPQERMLEFCVDFAVAWLEDEDASAEGSEKLALYYCFLVEHA
jgi:hypothetical protein